MKIAQQNKYWKEVSFPVNYETEEIVSNFLFELGAMGCSCQEDFLRAYFRQQDWNDKKRLQFQRYLTDLKELQLHVEVDKLKITDIENQDWDAEWKKSLKPINIDDKIMIMPSWRKYESQDSIIEIIIDPQMAFGTGIHATTQLVLKILLDAELIPRNILDMGCGTGILAIAAAKLFDSSIIAFDNDPIATETAQQNCINNNVEDDIQIFCGTVEGVEKKQFDLILANINRPVIVQSIPNIHNLLKPSGTAILSGILIEEKNIVLDALNKFNFSIIEERHQDEWLGLSIKK